MVVILHLMAKQLPVVVVVEVMSVVMRMEDLVVRVAVAHWQPVLLGGRATVEVTVRSRDSPVVTHILEVGAAAAEVLVK
jgi:hypothetical protein